MKKSEMIRAALGRVRKLGSNQRQCYCTPSRSMVHSVEAVALNENMPNQRGVMAELMDTLASKLREVTNRTDRHDTLRDFDTEDTDASYALNDQIVEEAFEKAAVMYEEQGE